MQDAHISPLVIHVFAICSGCGGFNGTHDEIVVDYGFSTRGTEPCPFGDTLIQTLSASEQFDVILTPKPHDLLGQARYSRVHQYSQGHCKTCGHQRDLAHVYYGLSCTTCGTLHLRRAQHNERISFEDFISPTPYPVIPAS